MRGNVALAAVTAAFLIGCGSSGRLASDAGPLDDATTADAWPDAASVDVGIGTDEAGLLDAGAEEPDVGPAVPCEAGAPFILVNYDGGSMVLRQGCGGAVAPTLGISQCTCAEDCFPTASQICGTSDAGTLYLGFNGTSGPASAVGAYAVGCFPGATADSWSLGSSTARLLSGQVRLQTFSAVGGTVTGDYVATLPMPGGTISGTFCVLRAQ